MSKPVNPYFVLLLSIVLPGAGHVAIGEARRGLAFALFVLLFSFLTYMTTTPEQSFLGRHAGGLFIWALSIPDAYRRARVRFLIRPEV
ncbi:hypothetical protein [Rhizobium sp. PL01]|uniref:hypothetical protein n=1 Tax=Rhizobium sp. PL01 TaxID=3085631 RepID=UPI0029817D9B|nr:hypothetical protein [Rhizobium sp. PL01]MDW5318422.1 hypothetical protein [Rhizobium sp. PL01]